jgi:hypothetical protein
MQVVESIGTYVVVCRHQLCIRKWTLRFIMLDLLLYYLSVLREYNRTLKFSLTGFSARR